MYPYRNPAYNNDGSIDCEINHPDYGWLPFTASATDPSADGVALFNQIVSDGGITPAPGIDLDELKLYSRYMIDVTAERARLRYITDGAGQASVYQEKAAEADAYITAGYPVDLTSWPFIQAEVNATGLTSTQAADAIVAQRNTWRILGANIEEERLGGKAAVNAAVDEAGIVLARSTAIVALDAI